MNHVTACFPLVEVLESGDNPMKPYIYIHLALLELYKIWWEYRDMGHVLLTWKWCPNVPQSEKKLAMRYLSILADRGHLQCSIFNLMAKDTSRTILQQNIAPEVFNIGY
ncbi:hypothetical protein TNCV_4432441 [Trichonephila clavipes]|nr:hypothetical protein TNCV_4432441 [Trichonephila clavipes]